MVRTLEGKQRHQDLMKASGEMLQSQGYQVVYRGQLENGVIDVIGIKGEEKIGVECQVHPSWKMLVAKTKKYKTSLTKFLIAIPKNVKVAFIPEGIELLRFDVKTGSDELKKVSILIGEKQLAWLRGKVESGDFSSISHGIRKCVLKVMGESQKG